MSVVGGMWVGADVRYIGPEGDGPLQPGVIGSVAETTSGRGGHMVKAGRRARLGREEVLVVLADGQAVVARIEDLEVTTPPHLLRPEPDGADARWLLDAVRPWTAGDLVLPVASFAPDTFPAVVKVMHPWMGEDGAPGSWARLAELAWLPSLQALSDTRSMGGPPEVDGWQSPPQGRLDHRTAGALAEVLQGATQSPGDVFVAVWAGWGGFPYERFAGAAAIPTESRGHRLLRGPLAGVLQPVTDGSFGLETSGIWWPADRAWVVVTEVDFEWTFVAGTAVLVEQLARHPDLEVLHSDMDAPANRLDLDRPA